MFGAALSACDRGKQWPLALAVLEQMEVEKVVPGQIACNSVVSACERLGRWQFAMAVMEKMQLQEVEMDTITFCTAICACAKGRAWSKVLQLWQAMSTASVPRNVILCSATINACAKGSLWPLALKVLGSMPSSKVEQNTITFNAAISACERGSQWPLALELLFREMPRIAIPRNIITYSAVISACEKAGEWRSALQILTEMRRMEVQADTIACSAAISACEKAAQWEVALQLLEDMRPLDVSGITYSATISACEKAQQWQVACEVFLRSGLPLESVPFAACIAACSRSGRWLVAEALLEEMSLRAVPKDKIACTAAIASCANGHHWRGALRLLRDMPLVHLAEPDVSSFSSALSACQLAGRWLEATELLQQMRSLEMPVDGIHLGCVVGALQLSQGPSAAAAWLRGSFDGGTRPTLPAVAVGGEVEGCSVLSVSPGLLVLDKAAGLVTEQLQAAVERHLGCATTSVSRLDRPTSGVLPVVLGQRMAQSTMWFQSQFAGRLVEKEYLCLCEADSTVSAVDGRQMISSPLRVLSEGSLSSKSYVDEDKGREAVTFYQVLKTYEAPGASSTLLLVKAEPRTGRMHQIRAHLASIGLPLVGDCCWDGISSLLKSIRHWLPSSKQLWSSSRRREAQKPLPSLPTPCCHPMALVAEPPAVVPAPHQQLYSLTRSSAWQEVLQMWCRFQNRAVETNIRMYNSVLSACGKSQWQRIQLLLSSSLDATTVTYNTALSADSTWRQAAAYVGNAQERGLQLDIITLNSLISNNTVKAWLKALELLGSGVESNLQKDLITFNVTMRGCQWFWAEALLEDAKENQLLPDLVSYNTAISALEDVSRWRGIFGLLQEMQQVMLRGDSITQFMLMGALNIPKEDESGTSQWPRCLSSLRCFRVAKTPPLANRALAALTAGKAGWEEALLLTAEMEGSAMELDVVTCNSLIKAYNSWHAWPATLQTLSEMSMRNLRCDLVTYNELLTQRWALAGWSFAELQRWQLESDLILFNAAISSSNRWDAAISVFQELRMEKFEADRISYNSVTGKMTSWQHAMAFQARSGIDSCNSMLSAYERESEWHRAFHLLAQQDVQRAAADVVSCNTVMSACEKSQHWALCFTIFETRESDVVSYGSMMSACEAAGRWQESLFLLEQLDGLRFQSNVVICNSAISTCEKASLWQHALSLWASFPIRRVVADVISYSATSSACEKCGRWELALQLFSELSAAQLEADSILFGACISACEKGSQWLAAITLLRSAADCTNLVTYNAAISACEKGLAWRSALALFAELQGEVQADVISYNVTGRNLQVLRLLEELEVSHGNASVIALSNAILACDSQQRPEMPQFCGSLHSVTAAMLANAGEGATALSALGALKRRQQWQEALALLEEHDQHGGTVPIKSYNTVMGACAKALQWSAALAMLQSLGTDGLGGALQPDVISFNSAMRACACDGAWPRSLTLLEELEKQKLQADVVSYSSVMAALPGEAWYLALALLQRMLRRRVEADLVCFNAAIGACAIAWLQAIAVLEDLQGHLGVQGADTISYNAVLHALGKGTQWQQAFQLLQLLQLQQVEANLVTFNASISCLERVAKWTAALGVLQQISQDDLQPDVISFNSSISQSSWPYALVLLGDLEEKLLVDHFSYAVTMRSLTLSWTWAFGCMERLQLQRLRPNAVVHNTLQGAMASSTLWSHALHVLGSADGADALMALSTLLGGLEERWEMAMGMLRDSQTAALVPDVVCIGSALGVAAAAWRQALDVLRGIQLDSVQQNMVIINTVISAMRNHWQRALALLREALKLSMEADLVAYNATVTSCEKGCRWVEALLLLREVKDVKLTADVITYSAAMSACNQADQWQITLSLFAELGDLRLRPSSVAINAAINGLGKGKQWTQAIQSFEAMQQGRVAPDVLTFHVASSACNAAAKWRQGAAVLRQLHKTVRCDLLTYHVSMSASASASWWRRSYQSLRELQDAGLQAGSVTFNVAVAPCERTSHWQDALHLVAEAEQLEADVILYNASIAACPPWHWRHGLALLAKAQAVSLADLASYAAVMQGADMVAPPPRMMNEIDDLAQGLLLTEWEMKKQGRPNYQDGVRKDCY
ncbi:unnamed protein product [Cladocopium goreaui]|uniref:Pentatricopeptide repeat-containing protein, chloroplastic n=1 Tax=Cladocopium goreaui TaxID=2562237 RepID=A0A9P1CC42_9DINO|nr:unnamed protein product [Cladocopium goreaui]